MSKVTKGFIIAAVILIVLGLAVTVGAAAGGGVSAARTLAESGKFSYSWNWDGGWGHHNINIDDSDMFDYGYEIYRDDREETYNASDIEEIDLEVGAGKVVVTNSDENEIAVRAKDMEKTQFYLDDNKLHIKGICDDFGDGTMYLELPENITFHSIEISAGASDVDADVLNAESIHIELGAGQIKADELNCKDLNLEVGAGSVVVKQAKVKDAVVNVDMGHFELTGDITGNLDAECGMGQLVLNMEGKVKDHNYDIECSVGNINIGHDNYSGLASERSIDNGAESDYTLECAMGNLSVNFID